MPVFWTTGLWWYIVLCRFARLIEMEKQEEFARLIGMEKLEEAAFPCTALHHYLWHCGSICTFQNNTLFEICHIQTYQTHTDLWNRWRDKRGQATFLLKGRHSSAISHMHSSASRTSPPWNFSCTIVFRKKDQWLVLQDTEVSEKPTFFAGKSKDHPASSTPITDKLLPNYF